MSVSSGPFPVTARLSIMSFLHNEPNKITYINHISVMLGKLTAIHTDSSSLVVPTLV